MTLPQFNNTFIIQYTSYKNSQGSSILENQDEILVDHNTILFFLLVFTLICIGTGIAITVIVLLIIFGLIEAILSASILGRFI